MHLPIGFKPASPLEGETILRPDMLMASQLRGTFAINQDWILLKY